MKASKRYLAITEGNIRRGIYFCKQAEIFLNDAVMQWFPIIEFAAHEAHWLCCSSSTCVVKKRVLWRFGDLSALSLFFSLNVRQSYNGRALLARSPLLAFMQQGY